MLKKLFSKTKTLLKHKNFALLLVVFSLFSQKIEGQEVVIAGWTFPTTTGAAPLVIAAECGVMKDSSAIYADGSNGSSEWVSNTSTSNYQFFTGVAPSSALCGVIVATGALSPTNQSNNGKSIVFKISMSGYKDLKLSYSTRGTKTGFSTQTWAYSVDGSTFTEVEEITGRTATSFSTQKVDFTSNTDINNASVVYIRLTFTGATDAQGNNRLDNIKFTAIDDTPSCTPAADPVGTISETKICGSTTLSYSGVDKANAYWQNTANGTSVSEPATSDKVVTSPGTYYLRILDGDCWSSSSINIATTVDAAIDITSQPGNQSVVMGNDASFEVVATGVATYQWQLNTGSGFVDISGATNNSYTVSAATLSMDGYKYRCVMTAVGEACDDVISIEATLRVTASGSGGSTKTYKLVTDNSELVAGKKYLIVGGINTNDNKAFAMSKQNTNNRVAVPVDITSDTIVLTPASSSLEEGTAYEFTLGGVSGAWTFYDPLNGGYLYAASSSSNQLKTRNPNSNADGEWAISIDAENTASIIAQGDATRNTLRYNDSSPSNLLFSCYSGTSQKPVYLYVEQGGPLECNAQSTWTEANVWSNGVPNLETKVVIEGSYDTQANGALEVCELEIKATGSLTVKPGYSLRVLKGITNLSETTADNFVIETDANLIQMEDAVNTGMAVLERRVLGVSNLTEAMDYIYWSSPVEGQKLLNNPAENDGFSPGTPNNRVYEYVESTDKFKATTDNYFVPGKGYAIRAETGTIMGATPNVDDPSKYDKTYRFVGVLNNGDITLNGLLHTDNDHGYNLVGNPYPSNIHFDFLYHANSDIIHNTVWFWTNISYTIYQQGSSYSGNNYAVYNMGSGGVPPTYNEDFGYPSPGGIIKAGQGFIIQTKTPGSITFNNSMRVEGDGVFYDRNSGADRFWLTLKSPKNMVNTLLLAYVDGATNGYESDYDSEVLIESSDAFYSISDGKKLLIQGRESFKDSDKVVLGSGFSENGEYTIRLFKTEGVFDGNQAIYLRDNLLDKHINLSEAGSYTFTAAKGTDHNRFEVWYVDRNTLGVDQNVKNKFVAFTSGGYLYIQSDKVIGNVELYDAAGRLVLKTKESAQNAQIDISHLSSAMYIVKVENQGSTKTKKIIK